MARSESRSSRSQRQPQGGIRVPVLGARLSKPDKGSAAWYAGLGLMGALEVIDWPVAMLVGVSHLLATSSRSSQVRQAAQGAETGS